MKLRKTFGIIFALGTLFALIPNALALTKMFQVNTLSGGSLTTGLVSYWNMQGNSNDYYGSNNGSDTSVSYGTSYGKVNQGANFNGGGTAQILIAANSSLDVTGGAYSISAWVNFQALPTSGKQWLIYGKGLTNASGYGYALLLWNNGGTLQLNMPKYGIANQNLTWTPSVGTWYHVVAVQNFSGTPTTVTFYVNGSSIGTTSSNTTAYQSSAGQSAYIGGVLSLGVTTAYLDEVGVWNKVLSTNEISDLYNGGAGQTMCNGTGGPLCSTPRHHVILISLNWKPEPLA